MKWLPFRETVFIQEEHGEITKIRESTVITSANANPNIDDVKQKGITSYALSSNRQRPLAGTLNAAIFNSARRFSAQVLYVAPPLILAYSAIQWAIER